MSILLSNMLEDQEDFSESIPLGKIHSKYIGKIIEYCEHYEFNKKETTILQPLVSTVPSQFITDPWECEFICQFNEEELIDMIIASNYLNIPALFELCCAKVAAEYKGKDFNEIKNKYGLNDVEFT